ncbi:MAG TPA: PadR family transcriptional regulator [Gemmatimonadaceae bacterium]|jgi:transcriptional regulator
MESTTELLQGTLDLLILKVLSLGPRHGWDISQRINEISEQLLTVNQGSLYPALHRLEGRGFVDAEWTMSATARRVRSYRITARGRQCLTKETQVWRSYSRAVNLILQTR